MTNPPALVRSKLMRATGQMFLPIFPDPSYAEANFREAESNADACTWLRRTGEWPNRRLALWGEAGRGKTHLLHVWAARTGATLWHGPALGLLPELPVAGGIALDDADGVPEETALLHLLNAASEADLPVLLAARQPPARWEVRLADLASRLRAVTAVEISAPEETLLRAILARLLADHQLRRLEPVQDWLLLRLPRNAAVLREAVDRLNVASLDHHRKITIPFATEVLADLLAPDEICGTDPSPSRNGEALL